MARNVKILFIVPPNITYEAFIKPPENVKIVKKGKKQIGTLVTDMPFGPLSLEAYVKAKTEAKSELLDFNVLIYYLDRNIGNFGLKK